MHHSHGLPACTDPSLHPAALKTAVALLCSEFAARRKRFMPGQSGGEATYRATLNDQQETTCCSFSLAVLSCHDACRLVIAAEATDCLLVIFCGCGRLSTECCVKARTERNAKSGRCRAAGSAPKTRSPTGSRIGRARAGSKNAVDTGSPTTTSLSAATPDAANTSCAVL